TMKRAEEAKVDVIVFGSGGARRIPEGFDAKVAHEQLVAFSGMLASLASNHGVTVVVEPLNKGSSNVLLTVAESAALVREVGHPSLRLLVDAFHFMLDDNDYESLVKNGYLLSHAHIATVPTRLPPGGEPCDFGPFFAALAKGGYSGRISIEAKIPNPEADLAKALKVMKGLAGNEKG
ncbi:MAG TPA: sugar phosphate isomerase/epimerase family protein, partial [Candidatus Brocadiia bacterium]|nr:sugar phosphate isomerase/epimerase family protein [Candidatus Brocadiia bacterium]